MWVDESCVSLTLRVRYLREWFAGSAILFVVAAFIGHVIWREHSMIAGVEHDKLLSQAHISERSLALQLGAIQASLTTLHDERQLMGKTTPGTFISQKRLQEIVRFLPGVSSISFADTTGRVVQSSSEEMVQRDVSGLAFYREASNSSDNLFIFLSGTSLQQLNEPKVQVVLKAVGQKDTNIGYLWATMESEYITELMQVVRYGPDVRTTLQRADIVKEINVGQNSFSSVKNENRLLNKLSSIREVDSEKMIAVVALRLPNSLIDQPVYVVATRDLSIVYAQWKARAVMIIQLSIIGFLVCAFLLGLSQRRRRRQQAITLLHDAETKAHAERLDFMLSGANVAMWDWNIASGTVLLNERWHAMLGNSLPQSSHPAEYWFSRVYKDDLPLVKGSLMRHWKGETTVYEVEYRMWHEAGHCVWVLDRAQVVKWGLDGVAQRMVGAHMDVSKHRHAEESLRLSEARFRALTELSSDWYWELDAEHRFVRFEGYPEKEISVPQENNFGMTRWDLGALNMSPIDWAAHRRVLDAHEVFQDLELQRMESSGSVYWMSVSGAPIFSKEGIFLGYRGIGRSITDRKRVEDEIERLAFYDALTGLPNRRLLLDRLSAALKKSGESFCFGALIFIDLDNFKNLNDTMGHDVGDSLLERVANRLITCVKIGDTVARLGGDEFVVMLEGLADSAESATECARAVGERILSALNHPYILDSYQHYSTPSMGIALFDGAMSSVDDVLKKADLAMYDAKAMGRNTLCFFQPAMQHIVTERAVLEADLRNAIRREELNLYYQPIVNEDGKLIGVEALLRWLHPERGMMGPNDFISLAEQTGLILPIGDWVIEQSCRQLVLWATRPQTSKLVISVNVSVRQFKQTRFAERMLAIFERTSAQAALMKFELTESLLLTNVSDVIEKMDLLRNIGITFTLDDFGTGYSSLSYLKRLPINELKIDQSFVRDLLTDVNDAAIVCTIITLAKSLGLRVVAEGVENEGQYNFLLHHGCKYFQGFLFGQPLPVESMIDKFN